MRRCTRDNNAYRFGGSQHRKVSAGFGVKQAGCKVTTVSVTPTGVGEQRR